MRISLGVSLVLAGCFLVTAGAAEDAKPGSQTTARFEAQVTVDGEPAKVPVNYLLFLPEGYGPEEKKWPLLLFLHGAGERGDDLALVKKHGPPKLVEKQKDFGFIVVSPQCPAGKRWDAAQLIQLVDHVAAQHKADPARIYVTGLSMGGAGTWALVAANPSRFAAAAPIACRGDVKLAEQVKDTPLSVFQGAKDSGVPVAQNEELVAAVKKAGGDIKLTVYPEAAHDAWTQTYNNSEFYKWLLAHERRGAK